MTNEHKNDCCYKDKTVLYALFEIVDNKRILISANELSRFDYYLEAAKNNDTNINIDRETCDNESYQIVYGALMFHDKNKDKLLKYINDLKGYAMIDLDGEDPTQIIASAYADICLFEDKSKHPESIPFVALMQTMCSEQETISTTIFPYCDTNVWENMVNRPFLLACRKFVKIDGLTTDNWKNHIDMAILDKAYQDADLYTGEEE